MKGKSHHKSHYQTIKGVIEHVVAGKLDLDNGELTGLAKSVGMTPRRLQKIFSEWAGISPKQFSRYLKLQYSKSLLAERADSFVADRMNMLKVTNRAGLSSGSRLHDLFINIEAMTPGEYRDGGAGIAISYSIFDTQFGKCLVASTERGICNVLFADSAGEAVADLRSRWPKAKILKKTQPMHEEIENYFKNISKKRGANLLKIKLHLHGTNFQIKVWEALLSIPDGAASTYGALAKRLGDAKLSRAVGSAVGDNPIGYIIPCHRVLKSTGEIGGYHWGVTRKRAMLGFEAVRRREE